MKILTIVGARPQFIKAAAVSRAISEYNKAVADRTSLIEEAILHTGQHYDWNMSDVFFEEMRIRPPDFYLNVNRLSHGAMTGQMLEKIEEVLVKEKPDIVLVYGDTDTTLAGALAAVKLHIRVAHVEAGLRSFNRQMPEEINRLVTDRVSSILFCPTETAVRNLKAEGIGVQSSSFGKSASSSTGPTNSGAKRIDKRSQTVALVGDVMYDSVLYYLKLAETKSKILEKLSLRAGSYALATVHRAENTIDSNRLKSIFAALEQIALNQHTVVLPLHPRTHKAIRESGLKLKYVKIIEPVSYLDMLLLEKEAKIILTDSGGVQKEAYWMKVPCITLRDETEWIETVEENWNILAGADTQKIVASANANSWPANQSQIFGAGQSSNKIVKILV